MYCNCSILLCIIIFFIPPFLNLSSFHSASTTLLRHSHSPIHYSCISPIPLLSSNHTYIPVLILPFSHSLILPLSYSSHISACTVWLWLTMSTGLVQDSRRFRILFAVRITSSGKTSMKSISSLMNSFCMYVILMILNIHVTADSFCVYVQYMYIHVSYC